MSGDGYREFPEQQQAAQRSPRASMLLVASCHREDGTVVRIKVRNISATGLKGECSDVADFGVDEQVRIAFRQLTPIAASIVRFEGNEIGIRFRNPVDVEKITKVLANAPLPNQSPRSEVVSNWIDRTTRNQQWERMVRGIRGQKMV